MPYPEWLKQVRNLLKARRPDVNLRLLDPNETFAAYTNGMAPIDFVLQARLPLAATPRASTSGLKPARIFGVLATLLVLGVLGFWFIGRHAERSHSGNPQHNDTRSWEGQARDVATQIMDDYCAVGLDGFKNSKWWPKVKAGYGYTASDDGPGFPYHARNPIIETVGYADKNGDLAGKGYMVEGLVDVLMMDGSWKTGRFTVFVDFNFNLLFLSVNGPI